MKGIIKLPCSLVILVFLVPGISWGEQADRKDSSSPSMTRRHADRARSGDSEVKKREKKDDDQEARKRAAQYLKYSGPGATIKKGWVGGGTTYVVPRHYGRNYGYSYYYPPPPLYPYYEPRPQSNDRLRNTLEATRVWNEMTAIYPRPGLYPARPVPQVSETQPATLTVVKEAAEPVKVAPPEATTVVGKVTGLVMSIAEPGIVVLANGKQYEYLVSSDAIVLSGPAGEPAAETQLSQVRMGDHVTLRVVGGKVIVLRVGYKVLVGTVTAVAKGTVLLDSGETFKLSSNTQVLLPDKTKGKPQNIEAGSKVKVQLTSTGDAQVVELGNGQPENDE